MASALLEAVQVLQQAAQLHQQKADYGLDATAAQRDHAWPDAAQAVPDEQRREQLRNYAQRSIKVVFDAGERRHGAAVLLRNVAAGAVERTSQFFSKFGEVQSAQRRKRNGSAHGECDVVIFFATDEPAERFVAYAAREGMPVEIQRTASSACGKRARNDITDPECAHWLSEMVNNRPTQKRPATHNDDGRASLLRELDAIAVQRSVAGELGKVPGDPAHQQCSPSSDGKLIKRKRIHFEQPERPAANFSEEDADFTEHAAAKAEFLDAVKEEHAKSIVHPANWGLSADAAREAAAAAEAAVANMRAGLDLSLDDMTLDCASEYDDIANETLSAHDRAESIIAGQSACLRAWLSSATHPMNCASSKRALIPVACSACVHHSMSVLRSSAAQRRCGAARADVPA